MTMQTWCGLELFPRAIEKLGYVATLAVLHGRARISAIDAQPAPPDFLLGILFIVAFVKLGPQKSV